MAGHPPVGVLDTHLAVWLQRTILTTIVCKWGPTPLSSYTTVTKRTQVLINLNAHHIYSLSSKLLLVQSTLTIIQVVLVAALGIQVHVNFMIRSLRLTVNH